MIGEPTTISRPSGTYIVDGMAIVDAPITLTFPPDFEVPELAGAAVPAFAFATRSNSSHPLWCGFKHPVDGRWRSVFARREWATFVASEPVKRGPFKRPTVSAREGNDP